VEKRSPLQDSPLPQAGTSSRQRIDDLLDRELLNWAAVMVAAWLVAAYEWLHYLRWVRVAPWVVTSAALVVTVWFISKWARVMPQVRRLKLGSEGEQVVGQMLEGLRAWGYSVFHDISDDGFNIDHVVVGPGGVFAMETKTISKRTGARVTYDGQRVLVDGREMDRDPIKQAGALADRVQEILKRETRRDVDVRPVVLFPGWWVEPLPRPRPRVWVLNAKNVAGFIANEPPKLSPEDVALYSARIGDWAKRRNAS